MSTARSVAVNSSTSTREQSTGAETGLPPSPSPDARCAPSKSPLKARLKMTDFRLVVHGTEHAYRQHMAGGEPACEACVAAHSEVRKRPSGHQRAKAARQKITA